MQSWLAAFSAGGLFACEPHMHVRPARQPVAGLFTMPENDVTYMAVIGARKRRVRTLSRVVDAASREKNASVPKKMERFPVRRNPSGRSEFAQSRKTWAVADPWIENGFRPEK